MESPIWPTHWINIFHNVSLLIPKMRESLLSSLNENTVIWRSLNIFRLRKLLGPWSPFGSWRSHQDYQFQQGRNQSFYSICIELWHPHGRFVPRRFPHWNLRVYQEQGACSLRFLHAIHGLFLRVEGGILCSCRYILFCSEYLQDLWYFCWNGRCLYRNWFLPK